MPCEGWGGGGGCWAPLMCCSRSCSWGGGEEGGDGMCPGREDKRQLGRAMGSGRPRRNGRRGRRRRRAYAGGVGSGVRRPPPLPMRARGGFWGGDGVRGTGGGVRRRAGIGKGGEDGGEGVRGGEDGILVNLTF